MGQMGRFGGSSFGSGPEQIDVPQGPRAEAWEKVQTALDEEKPKTALAALAGVEQAAIAEQAWAEAARAIATRVLAETGDRPGDDPERVILLAAEIAKAPPETRGVLEAIRANWTWGYYQANQWRYRNRTQGGADADDLASIREWDLPTVVAEIRRQFATAVGQPGSPEQTSLQALAIREWDALIPKGSMPDAYRPTVWDVVARDALEFASSGERGLMAPEDAFELDADSPALGTLEEFLAWDVANDETITDRDSPLLEAAALFRRLIEFHAGDTDPSALLSADLDRILWASNAAVGEGLGDRKEAALRAFIERAGDHETATLATFHRLRGGTGTRGQGRGRPPREPRRGAVCQPRRQDRCQGAFARDRAGLGGPLPGDSCHLSQSGDGPPPGRQGRLARPAEGGQARLGLAR